MLIRIIKLTDLSICTWISKLIIIYNILLRNQNFNTSYLSTNSNISFLTTKSNPTSDNELNFSNRCNSPIFSEHDSVNFKLYKGKSLLKDDYTIEKTPEPKINKESNDAILNKIAQNTIKIKDIFKNDIFSEVNDLAFSLSDFLFQNKLDSLLAMIENGTLTEEDLINLPDETIISYIEEENKDKFDKLREFLMKINDNNDADDVLKTIDKTLEDKNL